MKKNKKIISLTAAAALLCVGGAFALNANTSVAADDTATPKKQTMLGASVLLDGVLDGQNINAIRFPVVVEDTVRAQIAESKIYVLPAAFWTSAQAPTAEEIANHADKFVETTTDKWINYYEDDTSVYGDAYDEAVVYMYNIPEEQYANDFYVCSYIKLNDNDNTEEYSDVMARSMEEVAVEAVNSGTVPLEKVSKYLKSVEYTVTPYLRTIYGSYEKGAEQTVSGYRGIKADLDAVTVENGELNETLTAQANASLTVAENATLNVYYENNAYKFETQALKDNSSGVAMPKQNMSGVTAADLRGETYLFDKGKNNSATMMSFTYDDDDVGKYLVLNTYFISSTSYDTARLLGFYCWNANQKGASNIWYYDANGKLIPTYDNAAYLNKWVSFVVYLDETGFPKTSTNFWVSFFHNECSKLYFGEYTFLTEEQFKANFQYIETDTTKLPEGVVGYSGDTLTRFSNGHAAHYTKASQGMMWYTSSTKNSDGCTIKPAAVTSWAAGQYVAITIYSYTKTGSTVGMYSGTLVAVYDDKGNTLQAAQIQANKWYTYVFEIPNAVETLELYKGSIHINTGTTANQKFLIESVYSIAPDALDRFIDFKFPDNTITDVYDKFAQSRKTLPTSGVTTYKATNLTNNNGSSYSSNAGLYGEYLATPAGTTDKGWYERRMKHKTALTTGKYCAIEVMFTTLSGNDWFYVWNANFIGAYDTASGTMLTNDNTEVVVNKVYLYVYEVTGGTETFAFTNGSAGKAYIGNVYVFDSGDVFNNWIAPSQA